MKYCYHVLVVASGCSLNMLDKFWKVVCRTFGPTTAVSLEALLNCRNITSLSFSYGYFFGRLSFELVPIPYSCGNSMFYSNRLHDFPVTVPRYY